MPGIYPPPALHTGIATLSSAIFIMKMIRLRIAEFSSFFFCGKKEEKNNNKKKMESAKGMTSAKLAREFQHVVAGSNKDSQHQSLSPASLSKKKAYLSVNSLNSIEGIPLW